MSKGTGRLHYIQHPKICFHFKELFQHSSPYCNAGILKRSHKKIVPYTLLCSSASGYGIYELLFAQFLNKESEMCFSDMTQYFNAGYFNTENFARY